MSSRRIWSRWWSFHQILEKSYPQLLRFSKPIMISEFGTLAKGGDPAEWYRQAFYHMSHTYGRGVRAVVLFNQAAEEAWVKTIEDLAIMRQGFLEECTPGEVPTSTPSPVPPLVARAGPVAEPALARP